MNFDIINPNTGARKKREKQEPDVAHIRELLRLQEQQPTLKELRRQIGISQAKAAKLLGVSANHYACCERGKYQLPQGIHILMEVIALTVYYRRQER